MRPGIRPIATLAVAAMLPLFLFCRTSGAKDESPQEAAELKREIQIGRTLAARLARRYGIVRNEELTRYVALVGGSLAAVSARSELPFRFGILDTEEVNAFACPGGYTLITLGSLRLMENEAELAAVLAHEISHTSLQHAGRFEVKSGWSDFLAGFLSLGGGNIINTVVSQTVDLLEKRLLEQGREKGQELEADQASVQLMSQVGYGPGAALSYLNRVARSANREVLDKTHPAIRERIRAIENFAGTQGISQQGRTNKKRFQAMKAKLPKPTVQTKTAEKNK